MCKFKIVMICYFLLSKINCFEFLQVCFNGLDEFNFNVVIVGFSVGEVFVLIFFGVFFFEDGRYL